MAPALGLDAVRPKILADAVKLARHVNYRNAGTVEFMVDQSGALLPRAEAGSAHRAGCLV